MKHSSWIEGDNLFLESSCGELDCLVLEALPVANLWPDKVYRLDDVKLIPSDLPKDNAIVARMNVLQSYGLKIIAHSERVLHAGHKVWVVQMECEGKTLSFAYEKVRTVTVYAENKIQQKKILFDLIVQNQGRECVPFVPAFLNQLQDMSFHYGYIVNINYVFDKLQSTWTDVFQFRIEGHGVMTIPSIIAPGCGITIQGDTRVSYVITDVLPTV